MKRISSILAVMALMICQVMCVKAQTIILNDGFTSGASNWTIVNGSMNNKWYCGTHMYISSNGGANTSYSPTTASIVHFYQDVTLPVEPNLAGFHLKFRWTGAGEDCCDYLRVSVMDTSHTPLAGNFTDDLLEDACVGLFNGVSSSSTWKQANIVLPASYAGTTKRLVFTWRNDGSLGSGQPVSVDDVLLKTLPRAFKTLALTAAGTLQTSITATELDSITDLTLTGTIDQRDIIVLRDYLFVLTNLDLSGTTVAAYNTSPANVMPDHSFKFHTTPAKYSKQSLRSITLPASVTTIGESAFEGCFNLTSVTLPPALKKISAYAFASCLFPRITLPNTIDTIKGYAFDNATKLDSINLPDSLKSLDGYTFRNARSLTKIDIPNGVSTIWDYTFYNCISLTSVTIPASVTGIQQFAFNRDSNVTSMTVKALVPPTVSASTTFGLMNFSIPVYIPCGTLTAYQTANRWNSFTNFIEKPLDKVLTVKSNHNAMGTATITTHNTCTDNTAAITANANPRYRFVRWSDGNTTATRTLTLSSDTTLTAEFEQYIFSVTLSILPSSSAGTVSGANDYHKDSVATIVATPNPGYRFMHWSDGVTDSLRTFTVTTDSSLAAIFVALHQITVNVAAGQTGWGTVTGGGIYDAGAYVTVIATPNPGFRFVQWQESAITDSLWGFVVMANENFTAEFEIIMHTITVEANDSTMGEVTGGGSFAQGSTTTIEATPYYGFRFVQWTDGVTDSLRQITVTADTTYRAEFDTMTYRITVLANDATRGNVTGSGTFSEGSTTVITAASNAGYRFVKWLEDANADSSRTITVTADATYTAEFISTTTVTYQITAIPADPTMGTVTGGGEYVKDSTATLTAIPNAAFYFVKWREDNNTNATRQVTVTVDATYTAEFAAKPTYLITVTANDLTMGTVSGGGTFVEGSIVTITATPNTGYRFIKWLEDNNADSSRTITVTAAATYTAEFVSTATVTYQITAISADPTMGTVTGGGEYVENSTATLIATPNPNYRFVKWPEDNNTDATRQITVVAAAVYTAEFEPSTGIVVETLRAASPQVYPNPTRDNITLVLPDNAATATFILYDLQGRLLLKQTLNSDKEEISVSAFSAGLYTYSLSTDGKQYNGKLSIVK